MGVYGDREKAIRKIKGEPVKSTAGNAKTTRETMNKYGMVNLYQKQSTYREGRQQTCCCEIALDR